MTQVPTITIDALPRRIKFHFNNPKKPALMIWSAPGTGKSDVSEQTGKELADDLSLHFNFVSPRSVVTDWEKTFGYIDLRLSSCDPLDLKGGIYLDTDDMITRFLRASMLPDAKRHGKCGILILDELPEASPSTLVSASPLILNRRLGDNYHLPEDWLIIAAGNEQGQGASAKRLPSQINNRMGHCRIEPCEKVWADHLRSIDGDPRLAAWIQGNPEMINTWLNKDSIAFATPRSLVNASDVLELVTDDREFRESLVAGFIGTGPANELEGFLTLLAAGQMPTWDAIRNDPENAPFPVHGAQHAVSIMYAAMGLITRNVKTVGDMPSVMKYISRLPDEMQTTVMLDIKAHDEGLFDCRAVTEWRASHPTAI